MKKVYDIFSQLNAIPRASHHEEKVADFLCQFAEGLGLEYERDAENCVVIRKSASPGYEKAETIVMLNHMDMVAVGDGSRPFNPLTDGIQAYIEDGWMKAKGTSLGADNGIGLSMALAVLADDSIAHPALEVLTTTNEEDGMTGAANLSKDFVKGRKVINLDSEDYDTITVGAAGAYLQTASIPIQRESVSDASTFFEISISGGQGGHSGVDINKGRINAIFELCNLLISIPFNEGVSLNFHSINGGVANASIPGHCSAVVSVANGDEEIFLSECEKLNTQIENRYKETDANVKLTVSKIQEPEFKGAIIDAKKILQTIAELPCNVIRMRDDMPDVVMTSNNIGMISTTERGINISCHTRSFSDDEMVETAEGISVRLKSLNADVSVLMNTPGWQEKQDSDYLKLVDKTFRDVLGFSPRKVAMHFVLEAGYYVQKYPGIEIACIGPRILEPHSTKERVDLSTVENIWKVLVELLSRLKG